MCLRRFNLGGVLRDLNLVLWDYSRTHTIVHNTNIKMKESKVFFIAKTTQDFIPVLETRFVFFYASLEINL